MKERSFDEMIAYFNGRVADMDISQDCKMELLGMVTALGYKHEKSVPQWIPCSERLPEKDGHYLVCMSWDFHNISVLMWADGWNCVRRINGKVSRKSEIDGADIVAWMPLPEPYKGGDDE